MKQICAVNAATWKATEVAVKAAHPFSPSSGDPHETDADAAAVERLLLLEIDALSRLRHPGIAAFLGACFDDPTGRVLLVRELHTGSTLASTLAAGRAATMGGGGRRAGVWAPPRRQAVRWALQLAQALNYMHQCEPRVAHGDLGPACLLLSASGELKVHGGSAPCALHPIPATAILP